MATTPDMSYNFITKIFENRKLEPFFMTKALGANRIYSPTTKVNIRTIKHGGGMAGIGLRGDPANVIDAGVTLSEVEKTPPQIFEKDSVADEHLTTDYDPRSLANLESSSDVVRSFEYLYGKKADELKLRYFRRLEWMFSQLAFTGEISVSTTERAFTHSFDVDSPAGFDISSSTTDVLDGLGDVCANYAKTNGVFPNLIVTTPDVAKAILKHKTVEKWIQKNTFNMGGMTSNYTDPMTRFIGSFREFGVPEIYAYAGNYANSSGTATNYVPSGKLLITNTQFWNLSFAAQVDYDINENGNPVMGEFLSKIKISPEGKSKDLLFSSYPLPIVMSGDAVKILNVTV